MTMSLRNGRRVLMEPWIIDPNITYGSLTYTDSHTVTLNQRSFELIMNSASAKTFTLPSVTVADIGVEFFFTAVSTGRLTLQAVNSDTIDDSNAGGTIYTDTDTISSIHLRLVSATHWQIIGANGTWVTT